VRGRALSMNRASASSDAITHSFVFVKRMGSIIERLSPEQVETTLATLSTIGGYILFPAKKIENKITINGARGFNARIVDRFDLSLECIGRNYLGLKSP